MKFIALSGTTGVTENCYIYEQGTDMIMVDCGVGFPNPDMYGVDLIIPDFTYVKENIHKLKAILITHGHEDHIGALPFLFADNVDVPIYATKLVAGFIEEKFEDKAAKKVKVNVFDPDRDILNLGSFRVTAFRVSHSVPDGVGFCIESAEGKHFHIPDYKFDWTPVDKKPFDVNKLAVLAKDRVISLASDALGSNSPGYTDSEITIEPIIENIVNHATQQVFFTTISSNISRIQQALNVAIKNGRKVAFIGRSIDVKAQIAKKLGYLHYPDNLVIHPRQIAKLPADKRMYIISGSYGQTDSALTRVAMGEHDLLAMYKGDTVIYSSDPAPPGSKESVDAVVDQMIQNGIDVHYYDIQEDLHVSGHGSSGDIKMLMAIVKPKYYMPIGGTVRHNRGYANIAYQMGAKPASVFELNAGDIVEFVKDQGKISGRIPVRQVLVDGLGVGDVGSMVLRDRQVLAKDGVLIALIQFDKAQRKIVNAPELISRGFVFEGKSSDLLEKAADLLKRFLNNKNIVDSRMVKAEAANYLEKYFWEEIKRRPMILPVVVEV